MARSQARRAANQLRQTRAIERLFAKEFKKEFRARKKDAAAKYIQRGLGGVDLAMLGHNEKLAGLVKALYLKTGSIIGQQVLAGLKGSEAFEHKDYEEDLFQSLLNDYVTDFSTLAITDEIAQTTRLLIKREIQKGIAEGLSSMAIARKIRAPGIDVYRSRVVARTETHNAAGFASNAMAEASIVPNLEKTWWTAVDDRVRDAHKAQRGDVVAKDEPFVFSDPRGAYELMYAGDRNGPARGIIQCRCVTLYDRPEE